MDIFKIQNHMKPNQPKSIEKKEELIVITNSDSETKKLGIEIGKKTFPGAVFFMTGDLGSGKTTFVQGFALGMDVPKQYYITSPTYTLIHEYPGRVPFFHADLYRIDSQESIEEIGLPEIIGSEAVIVIEWADKIKQPNSYDHIHIHLEILEKDTRRITIKAYGLKCHNLIKEIF